MAGIHPGRLGDESFAIAVSPEFRYCVRSQTGCWYAADNARLDEPSRERRSWSIVLTSIPTRRS